MPPGAAQSLLFALKRVDAEDKVDRINIFREQVISLDSIAAGIQGLRIIFVNVFGITHADGAWTLIDSGPPFSEHVIRNWAEDHFDGPPNAILLTHGHFDHASCAGELAAHWNVPVYAHSEERPYLNGEWEYPAPNFAAGGGLISLLSPVLPRGPMNIGDRLHDLPNGKQRQTAIAEMPGWLIVHTPGHTPGHVSLFRPEDRTLLAGDAFCTTKPESFFEAAITQEAELHGPPAYLTSDWAVARQSVQLLADLEPRTVAPGHGRPIAGPNTSEAIRELALHFDEVAIPANRRMPAA